MSSYFESILIWRHVRRTASRRRRTRSVRSSKQAETRRKNIFKLTRDSVRFPSGIRSVSRSLTVVSLQMQDTSSSCIDCPYKSWVIPPSRKFEVFTILQFFKKGKKKKRFYISAKVFSGGKKKKKILTRDSLDFSNKADLSSFADTNTDKKSITRYERRSVLWLGGTKGF